MKTTRDAGIIFPGQGSQYPGMGREVHERYKEVRELYDLAQSISNKDWAALTFAGSAEELKQTQNTQPAIFLLSVAYSQLLKDKYNYAGVAGHSLGEYTALTEAGVLSFEDAFKATCIRGDLMANFESADGGMLAIIGAKLNKVEETVEEFKDKGVVNIANYNSPMQVVVSGERRLFPEFKEKLLEKTRAKVISLPVSAAFHSPLMEAAAKKMAATIQELEFNKPEAKYFSNVTGDRVDDPGEIKELLIKQILSPVRWIDVVKNMKREGISFFLEVGPGGVLTNLVKRIDRQLESTNTDSDKNFFA